jgi:hypothetical protein
MKKNKTYQRINITIFSIVLRPDSYLKTRRFGEWILSPSSGRAYSDVSGHQQQRQ